MQEDGKPVLSENQLRQARALLQDIRIFMVEQTKGHHPMLDYRMVDVFRGLELADKGLDALISDKNYSEIEALTTAYQKFMEMPGMQFTDDEIREKNES
jgi:hypothetical protein